jgi:urea transporter
MISIPDHEAGSALTPAQCLLRGVPRSYAILFFSPDKRLGWLLLSISLLAPDIGLSGLLGAIAAGCLALGLGFERGNIRNGYLLFNPLLVCLTLGLMNRSYDFPATTFAVLWLAAVLGGFFLAVAMQKWVGQQFGLSAQSIPAMSFSYILYFLSFSIAGPASLPVESANLWLDLDFLPSFWRSFFETFGAMLFEPRVLPGLLVFCALASVSPLATLMATCSFAVGVGTMGLLGFAFGPEDIVWCGFNFLLSGIALGASYFAPSRASLLLAIIGAFLCALVALALASALRYFGLPASALPYNLVVLILVYALRQRTVTAGLHASPAPGMLPETAGRFVVLNATRFPHLDCPALSLPLRDECVITQGVDGTITHRPPWNWALDFEVIQKGHRWMNLGEQLEDYHAFDKVVIAPCEGTVAAIVNHIHDNPPGSNNPEDNWGNYVVIYHDAGYYVLLAHLRHASSLVVAGQRVYCGQPLGRCGNSGRSPIPHLHLQVQEAPYPGAATRPFCLRHYLEISDTDAQPSYVTSGLPAQTTRIAWPTPLPALHSLFSDWLPGEYRYRISNDEGKNSEETILLDFDDQGRFRLRSRRYQAQLTAFFSHQVFYMTDYDGVGDSVLALFAVGLARVPCLADPNAVWRDFASPVPFHAGFLRRAHGLADPFIGPGLLEYQYGLQVNESGFDVHCRLRAENESRVPGHTPQRITTGITPRLGVDRIEARLWNDTKVTVELIDPLPHRPQAPPQLSRHPLESASTNGVLVS